MLKRFSDWLYRSASIWVLAAGLAIFLAFMLFVLPGQSRGARGNAQGAGSPDTSLTYSREDLYQMAEAYGEAGRARYIRARWSFDLVFPVVYGLFLITVNSWIFDKALPVGSRWRLVNLVPVAGVGLDYLENLSTTLVMARFPAHTPLIDSLAPLFTLLKWIFVGGSFGLIFIGLVVLVWRRISSRKTLTS